MIENVLTTGARAWGVNPRRTGVSGLRCYPSIAELPEVPDIAVLLLGAERLLAAAEEAVDAGVKALVVPGLGAEAGRDGRSVGERLAEIADGRDVPILGPNCMGIANPLGTSAWIGTLGRELRGGRVAAVVQSGSVGEALCALGARVGFRCIASVGLELNRDAADWCAALAADDETAAVGLFIESVRRPAALHAGLELLAEADKPVVCLRVGKSSAGARATVAHTDAVLTPERAFAAMARATNLIEAHDYAEFVEMLELLGRKRRPQGTRIAAVTQSGGEAALLGDLAAAADAPMPDFSPHLKERLAAEFPPDMPVQNPLDAWVIDDTVGTYGRVFEAIAESGEFDALVVQLDQSPFVGRLERDVAEAITRELTAIADSPTQPVLLSMNSSEPVPAVRELTTQHDIPLLRGSAAPVSALVKVGGWRPRRRRRTPELGAPIDLPAHPLGQIEAARYLEAEGVRFSAHRRVDGVEEAIDAASELGWPVVLKSDRPGHRAAIGGVELDVANEDALRAAADRIGTDLLIVAQQIPSAPEIYCGGRVEPDYGPVLCVGWGGRYVEGMLHMSCALAPVPSTEALEVWGDVPGLRDVCPRGFWVELSETVAAVSRVIARLPVGAAIDVNPILISPDHGIVAVDALIAPPNATRRVPGIAT
jgi:acetyltransferase